MQAKATPLLRYQGVVKQLGGTLAVDHVDLDVEAGEIHALLGANGAGKSTLIKLLAGIHQPDQGEILFKGQLINRADRDKLPIAFIHQDLGLFDWMTVAENIAMERGYARKRGLIDWKQLERDAATALEIVGSDIHPATLVSELTRTEKSIVALARALARDVDLLVLDEPTSSLPEADVAKLFTVLRRLKERGVGMIYVTHRLDEVFRMTDRVTVMRDGHKVGSAPTQEMTPEQLVLLIVGQPPAKVFVQPSPASAEVILDAKDICVGPAGPVSFQVRAGEILGLCGLRGAGQDLIGRALCGIEMLAAGSLSWHGEPFTLHGPGNAIRQGIAFISSKREEESLGMTLSVKENLFLNPATRGRKLLQFMPRRDEWKRSKGLVDTFIIRPGDPNSTVSTLSGGNQQKVVLARWLDSEVHLLVMEEPTLGVDVGAKADIYSMLHQSLAQGHAVVLVSSDLEEVAGVCNRALIFNRGHLVGELQREDLSIANLTTLVTGAASQL
jgi:ribose transport system ATP-binding protein